MTESLQWGTLLASTSQAITSTGYQSISLGTTVNVTAGQRYGIKSWNSDATPSTNYFAITNGNFTYQLTLYSTNGGVNWSGGSYAWGWFPGYSDGQWFPDLYAYAPYGADMWSDSGTRTARHGTVITPTENIVLLGVYKGAFGNNVGSPTHNLTMEVWSGTTLLASSAPAPGSYRGYWWLTTPLTLTAGNSYIVAFKSEVGGNASNCYRTGEGYIKYTMSAQSGYVEWVTGGQMSTAYGTPSWTTSNPTQLTLCYMPAGSSTKTIRTLNLSGGFTL
jgi:hypothetical protein